jgi:uncharacterized OB-fold protein
MTPRTPLVDYLALEPSPRLRAHECTACGAKYFGRRNACANCSGVDFTRVDLVTEGTVRTYTIVAISASDVPAPFASAIIDCDGVSVRGNLTNVEPSPDAVSLGMPVRLTTYSLGVDAHGVEGIGYAFEPVG